MFFELLLDSFSNSFTLLSNRPTKHNKERERKHEEHVHGSLLRITDQEKLCLQLYRNFLYDVTTKVCSKNVNVLGVHWSSDYNFYFLKHDRVSRMRILFPHVWQISKAHFCNETKNLNPEMYSSNFEYIWDNCLSLKLKEKVRGRLFRIEGLLFISLYFNKVLMEEGEGKERALVNSVEVGEGAFDNAVIGGRKVGSS